MYCQTCGTLIDENLNYCNRCGNRVAKNELATQKNPNSAALQNLAFATGLVGFTGLGGLIGLIAILVSNNAVPELIVILSTLFLAATFAICFMLTRQMSRLTETLPKKNLSQKFVPEKI